MTEQRRVLVFEWPPLSPEHMREVVERVNARAQKRAKRRYYDWIIR